MIKLSMHHLVLGAVGGCRGLDGWDFCSLNSEEGLLWLENSSKMMFEPWILPSTPNYSILETKLQLNFWVRKQKSTF